MSCRPNVIIDRPPLVVAACPDDVRPWSRWQINSKCLESRETSAVGRPTADGRRAGIEARQANIMRSDIIQPSFSRVFDCEIMGTARLRKTVLACIVILCCLA